MGIRSLSTSSIKSGVRRNRIWDQNISFGSDFYQIATTTVGAGGTSYVEFTSIPQTYTHLQIRGIQRFSGTPNEFIYYQLNSDTTASNYNSHSIRGDGAAVTSSNFLTTYPGIVQDRNIPGSTNITGVFGCTVFDLLDYTNTNKFKTARIIGGYDSNGSGVTSISSGAWRSTSAVTSIKLYPASGSFTQYTSFALYGIKG